MLTIKTKLKEFKGKGIGLVADKNIKKGTAVWTYSQIIDIFVKNKDIPKESADFFETYGVKRKGGFFLNLDNARFINHSFKPNTKSLGHEENNIAIKNIKKGEEITINYEKIEGPIDFKAK
jgi:SET domain-containing protein